MNRIFFKNNEVVKGINFEDLRSAGDPVELAKRYDGELADELMFLDITASHEKKDSDNRLRNGKS